MDNVPSNDRTKLLSDNESALVGKEYGYGPIKKPPQESRFFYQRQRSFPFAVAQSCETHYTQKQNLVKPNLSNISTQLTAPFL
jgi:hypothetical protein